MTAGERRRLLVGAVAVAAIALGLAAAATLDSSRPAGAASPAARAATPAAPPAASAAITGFRATLTDEETPIEAGVAWTTRWQLCWDAVPGADAYLLTIVTSEGVSPVPRTVSDTCYRLTVASGTAPRSGERPGRDGQVGLMEVHLSVSVAARFPDGRSGPNGPDFPVGSTYP